MVAVGMIYNPRSEHVAELARTIHPTDDEAFAKLHHQWCHQMKHQGGRALLAHLEALPLEGSVEAACKTVIGQRLKASGMRWGEDGADAVSHLRALYLSEPSQWETFWEDPPN